MKNKALRSVLGTIGFGVASLFAGAATAGVTYYPPITNFQDDNMEWFFDSSTNGTAGIIDVGDRFVGVFEIVETFGTFGGGPTGFGGSELTGVFDWTIVSKIANGTRTVGSTTYTAYDFTYAPTSGGLLSAFGPGAMIAAYLDATPDLQVSPPNCNSLTTCAAAAGLGLTDGSALWAVAGYTGDVNEFAAYNGIDNIAAISSVGASTKVAAGNYGFGVIVNNAGVVFNPFTCDLSPVGGDGKVQVCGSGDVLGGLGLANGAIARSDIDFAVAVPEPQSLALLSLALIGLSATARRRKS